MHFGTPRLHNRVNRRRRRTAGPLTYIQTFYLCSSVMCCFIQRVRSEALKSFFSPQSILSSLISGAFIVARSLVWFHGFPAGWTYFLLRLCALFLSDASSEWLRSAVVPWIVVFQFSGLLHYRTYKRNKYSSYKFVERLMYMKTGTVGKMHWAPLSLYVPVNWVL